MNKTILLIGPSYIGKSTFAQAFSEAHPEVRTIEFQKYRDILKFRTISIALFLCEFIVCWRRVFFILLSNKASQSLATLHRIAKYGFITFLLLKKFDHKENCIFDEELMKKLMDATPIPSCYDEYLSIRNKLRDAVPSLAYAYLRSIDLQNKVIIVADCPYSVAKFRAKKRHLSANVAFIEREFRSRYTLERRIYREILALLKKKNINHVQLNTADTSIGHLNGIILTQRRDAASRPAESP